MVASTLATLTGWLLFFALVLALGAVAARLLVLPWAARLQQGPAAEVPDAGELSEAAGLFTAAPSGTDGLLATAARVGLAGAVLTPAALALVFVRQLLEFRDPFVPWTQDARLLLLGTAWGDTWTAALVVSLVCAAGFVLAVRGRAVGWWLGVPAALALGAFPALTGHASGSGGLRWLTVPADILHVWAAGFWVGGLAFVLYADRRVWRAGAGAHGRADIGDGAGSVVDAGAGADIGAMDDGGAGVEAGVMDDSGAGTGTGALGLLVPAFSRVAVASVAVLVLTGTLAAWIHVPGPSALVSEPYGRTLLLKLALALVVLALGATNWRRLTPRLREPGGGRALRRSAAVELCVAQLVLLVTALLVRTAP